MKKSYIKIIIGVVFIALLAFIYFFLLDDNGINNEVDNGETNENSTQITTIEKSDIKNLIIKSDDKTIEIIPNENEDGKWLIKGYEAVSLNQTNIDSFVGNMSNLSGREVINPDKNLAQYGLDKNNKSITVKFDDKESVVYVGTATPDSMYYYAKKSDDDKIYMVDSINGKRIEYTLDDFIDKSLEKVSPYKIYALNIKRKGKEEIDLEYTSNKEGNAENLMSMGMETINMNKPYPNLAVYPNNLQESVLSNITDLQLGKLVEANLNNLDKYGLNSPEAEINISDDTNSLKLVVGNKADDKNYYCVANDKNAVFLIDEKYINPFINADPIKFVEKFVCLHYRVDVNKVELNNNGKVYTVTFGEEVATDKNANNATADDSKSKFNDNRKTYINEKEVDKSTFSDFFELLAGITFDNIDESAKSTNEKAEVVLKYTLNDGTVDEVQFIPYNDSFYIVNGRGIEGMLVSKQNVSRVFSKADEIIK